MSKKEPMQFNYKNGRGTVYFADISDEERDRRHRELERVAIIVAKERQRLDEEKKRNKDKGAI